MYNLTHPDILEMQRKGYLGSEPKPVAICDFCHEPIQPGEKYYDTAGAIVCDEYECKCAFLDEFKKIAEEDDYAGF